MITDIAIGLIQFHSTSSYWTEMKAKCFIQRIVCSSMIHVPHVSGICTTEQIMFNRSSHPRAILATELLWRNARIQTVTLDMHRQQRFVE